MSVASPTFRRFRTEICLAATLFAMLAAAGCQWLPSIEKYDLEESLRYRLHQQRGHWPDAVDCPHGLYGEVGTVMECRVTDGDRQSRVIVTVGGLFGDRIEYDFRVEEGS